MKRALNILYLLLPIGAAGYAVLALFSPKRFLQAGALAVVSTFMALVYLFPATFLGIVILALATSPDIFIESKIAGMDVKGLHRLLLLLAIGMNIWRYGFVWRWNPPIVALLMMFLITLLAADMLPSLTQTQMVRSLVALMLPFLFLHCFFRRDAIDRYLLLIALMPLLSVIGGTITDLAGIRTVFGEEWRTGAIRLGGMNRAATLAQFAYIAFFVSVYQGVTRGRNGYYLLAGVNLVIILLTGTRMMLLTAAIIGAAGMLFVPQRNLSIPLRVRIAVAGMIVIGAGLLFLWPSLEARFTEAGMSGRDRMWAVYLAAIGQNPWFGRGIGSGTVVLLGVNDWRVMETRGAHNEYLRITMDAGIVGLIVYVTAMVLWVRSELHFMWREERVLFSAFMVAFAIGCTVDNLLSSQPTPVTFFALALMVQRARQREVAPARPHGVGYRMALPRSIPQSPTLSRSR